MNEGEPVNMQTPAAKLQPKQQYLNLMMNTLYMTGDLCRSQENSTIMVKQLGFLVHNLASFIPNPKERDRLLNYKKSEMEKAKKINKPDEKTEYLFEVYENIIGEVMTLLDDVLAIVEKQEVLDSGNSVADELEKEFYPDGLPEYEDEGV